MSDDSLLWTHKPPVPHQARKGEVLFEFVRASDRAPMSCELRFHGESYGWEVLFFERGDNFYGDGAWVTKAAAIAWAEGERAAMERWAGRVKRSSRNETANSGQLVGGRRASISDCLC
jgi:hypothetical protein